MASRSGVAKAAAGGRRADLGGRYFRSRWESNYARFLNLLVAQKKIGAWEYEPTEFWFDAIKRGTRSYKPDFKVIHLDGSHEWHEVKGWMDPQSKTKLARMAKYFPSEKVVVIDAGWFRQARRGGLAACIPGWEHGSAPSNIIITERAIAEGGSRGT